MKKNIHPPYSDLQVKCSRCKKLDFTTASTLKQNLFYAEQCINCHPFYTKHHTQNNQNKATASGRQRSLKNFQLSQLTK